MAKQDVTTTYDHMNRKTIVVIDDDAFYRRGHYPNRPTLPVSLVNEIFAAADQTFRGGPVQREVRTQRAKNNAKRLLR